jgi:hypothetical protein
MESSNFIAHLRLFSAIVLLILNYIDKNKTKK